MRDEVLKRAMFAKPLPKSARNSGIMQGFEDDSSMEEMPPMARTPQNPEILMNTLRGDMRSTDARYSELADLVGDKAARGTPPEVLALLQAQLSQQQQPQQQGIAGLPQMQGMAPPPNMPPPGGQPPGAPPGMPPPGGPQGPFPAGGAEQAPPTPDGLPPIHAQAGAFVNMGTRLAQLASGPIQRAAELGTRANQAAGEAMSKAFPTTANVVFENVRGPGGRFTSERILNYPTLTSYMGNLADRAAAEYPRTAAVLNRVTTPIAGLGGGLLGAMGISGLGAGQLDPNSDEAKAQAELVAQIPTGTGPVPAPAKLPGGATSAAKDYSIFTGEPPKVSMVSERPPASPVVAVPPSAVVTETPVAETPVAETKPTSLTDFLAAAAKAPDQKGKIDRIKAAQKEYAPLFKELLGDSGSQDDIRTNALLLLSDAGFKLAASKQPTMGMALGEALSGMPKGLATLVAQAKENNIKVNTAALQQAITSVDTQDKFAQQLQLAVLKGDYDVLKAQATASGKYQPVVEDAGMGMRNIKINGSLVGTPKIDPEDPAVRSAITSSYTLRPTDNPFVQNRGQSPLAVETDKAERIKLGNTLRSLDNSLSTLSNLKGTYASAYSPGTWFSDKVNNLLVPVSAGVINPNLDLVDASTRISTGMNGILKNIASANDNGRVAVQEQQWARDTAKGISDPTAFFANKEIAAKQFNAMEATLRNSRQQVLSQLGYEGNDYVMQTPNTGTQSDPFTIPADPAEQKRMFTFLAGTIGKYQDPKATVYLRLPNNQVKPFSPTQLRGLMQ